MFRMKPMKLPVVFNIILTVIIAVQLPEISWYFQAAVVGKTRTLTRRCVAFVILVIKVTETIDLILMIAGIQTVWRGNSWPINLTSDVI